VHSWNYQDRELLPHAVIVHIEGFETGLDDDVEQWIPVMTAGRGDNETEPGGRSRTATNEVGDKTDPDNDPDE